MPMGGLSRTIEVETFMKNAGLVLPMHDGARIPQIGLGVMFVSNEDLPGLMRDAVELGYRHFDTATHYSNEAGVGEGLRALDIDRDDLFVTTKLPNDGHGFDATLRAFDASEAAIGRIDLYLLHWPQPPMGLYRESWRAMVQLKREGRVRSIGVSNFPPSLIEEIEAETGELPVVNQIQVHPFHQQAEARAYHAQRGIITESWSPLAHGRVLADPVIAAIAERHGCSTAEVVLRWHLLNDLVIIPKAASRHHLASNLSIPEIALSAEDLTALAALERPEGRIGPDPMVHVTV